MSEQKKNPELQKMIAQMTKDELKAHLLTADYKGSEFKSLVLDELIARVKVTDER